MLLAKMPQEQEEQAMANNDRTTVFVATAPWTYERRTVDAPLEEGTTVAVLFRHPGR